MILDISDDKKNRILNNLTVFVVIYVIIFFTFLNFYINF